jgi:hypothetical protein
MPELEELRYPFLSIIEFFKGGYWSQLQALHLTFAWLCVFVMAWMLFREPRDIGQKLLALYFALTLFNNPCFQIWGASLGDIFGVISAVVLILRVFMCPQRQFRLTEIAGLFLICAGTFAVHAFIIYLLYPNLNEGMIGVVRFILIAKVAVLGLNVLLFRKVFNELDDIDWLLNQIVNFAVVALICYFIQIGICFTGQLPYGTYIDAGFTGLPSFGSEIPYPPLSYLLARMATSSAQMAIYCFLHCFDY